MLHSRALCVAIVLGATLVTATGRAYASDSRLLALARTATATPSMSNAVTVSDPPNDTVGGHATAGDIASATAGGTSSTRTFSLTTVTPTSPQSDPAWTGTTGIVWEIDTNFDNQVDDTVVVTWSPAASRLLGAIYDGNNHQVCAGSASYTSSSFSASFGICSLRAFQWQVVMVYDNTPGNPYDDPQTDLAPNRNSAPPTPAHRDGYWMLGADGRTYGFCGAPTFAGSIGAAAAFAPRPDGTGMLVVARNGVVVSAGRIASLGSASLVEEVAVAMAVTPTGRGYWIFTSRGRVFHFGDAGYFGDLRAKQLNKPVIAAAATPSGRGYYMVGFDGGVFTFGDAVFHGSLADKRLNAPIVGVAATLDGQGYWLVGIDGGVFSFHAPFRGSMGGKHLNRPVIGITAHGNGYMLAATDGGVFNFTDTPFCGSLGGTSLPAPIIAIASFSI